MRFSPHFSGFLPRLGLVGVFLLSAGSLLQAQTTNFFTSNGTNFIRIVFNTPGSSNSWTVSAGITNVEYLVVGGGGGAGGTYSGRSGGGGGGAVRAGVLTTTPNGRLSVVVGAAGAGGNANTATGASGKQGGASVFGSITAPGGGGGAGTFGSLTQNNSGSSWTQSGSVTLTSAGSGASGGGGAAYLWVNGQSLSSGANANSNTGAGGISGAGNGGGNALAFQNFNAGQPYNLQSAGGGGGAGGAGGNATANSARTSATPGQGGAGISSSLENGSSKEYGRGGNAGASSAGSGNGNPGAGGNGRGSGTSFTSGSDGTAGIVVLQHIDLRPVIGVGGTATLLSEGLGSGSASVTNPTGATPITQRGFLVSLASASTNPVLNGTGVLNFQDSTGGTGSFTTQLSGLISNTNYVVRPYAVNSYGVGYGAPITLNTAWFSGLYTQDFQPYPTLTTTNLGDGSVMAGGECDIVDHSNFAGGTQKSMRILNDSTQNAENAFFLPNLNPGQAIRSFRVSFDVHFMDSGGGADAFSFNFGTVLTTNQNIAGTSSGIATSGTNRVGTNLSVVWDTYSNGSPNINKAVRAVRNEGGTNQIILSNSPVLPHVPSGYSHLHFRRADIVWENNQLSVSYNGQVAFTNLPTGSFAPAAGDIFTFAGITGSQDMHASIDNLRVETSTNPTLPLPASSGFAPTLSYGGNRTLPLQQAVNLQPVYGGGAFTPATPFAVTRFAGSGSAAQNLDAQGTNAMFFQPAGLAVDRWGYVYVADWARHSVRKISPEGLTWTLAGSGSAGGNNSTTGPRDVTFNRPTGVAVDTNGNVYVSERDGFRIRKLTPAGASTTLAGTGSAASADGTGTAAGFDYPEGICIDPSGQYLFVADSANDEQGAKGGGAAWGIHSIRRITISNAVVTRLAGDDFGYVNGTGTNAKFATPVGVACDGANLYVAELTGNRIRKLALSNNSVTTLAGATNAAIGTAGSTDGIGTAARFSGPRHLALDSTGTYLYVADSENHRIRRIHLATSNVETVAGSGAFGATDGTGTAATFHTPYGFAIGPDNTAYISHFASASPTGNMIRKMNLSGYSISPALPAGLSFNPATGVISGTPTVASGATTYTVTTTGPFGITSTTFTLTVPGDLNADFTDESAVPLRVSSYSPSGDLTVTFATPPKLGQTLVLVDNTGANPVVGTFNGLAEGASLTSTLNGDTFHFQITYQGGDGNDVCIIRVPGPGQQETVELQNFAGTYFGGSNPGQGPNNVYDGTGPAAKFQGINSITSDAAGNFYVADGGSVGGFVRKVTPAGVVTTLAGVGPFSSTNSGWGGGYVDGTGSVARFNNPYGIAVNRAGDVFVGDAENEAIRKVTAGGVVTTFSGTNQPGSTNGSASVARYDAPAGLAFDPAGNLYVTELGLNDNFWSSNRPVSSGHRVRKVDTNGAASSYAGRISSPGGSGRGYLDGASTNARFFGPNDIQITADGTAVVLDGNNSMIRTISTNGTVGTLAGATNSGFADGSGTNARFYIPKGLGRDVFGNLYVADYGNYRIRKVETNGAVTTVFNASNSYSSFTYRPIDVAADPNGFLMVATERQLLRLTRSCPPLVLLTGQTVWPGMALVTQDATGATVTGTVNPNGYITTAWFEYGTNSTNLNLSVPVTLGTNNSTNAQAVSAFLTNLISGTNYFYRLVATNVEGRAVDDNLYNATWGSDRAAYFTRSNVPTAQTISFASLPARTYGDAPFTLSATASSGLPVTYTSSDTSVATISSNVVTLRGGGTTTITARQSGNTAFSAASNVIQTLTVAKRNLWVIAENRSRFYSQANPTFTATYSNLVAGDSAANSLTGLPGFDCAATSTSAPGTYTITPKIGSLTSSKYNFFAFTDGTLTVSKYPGSAGISGVTGWGGVWDVSTRGLPFTVTTYPPGMSYVITYNGSTNFPTVPGTYTTVVTILDDNYSGVSTNTTIVSKAGQSIVFNPLGSNIPLKDLTNVAVSATASSGLPVTLSLDPGSAASLGGTLTNGTGTLNNIQSTGTVTLRAVQAGDTFYFPATNTISFNVAKNNQTITFSNLPSVIYSNGLTVLLSATASSGLDISYSVQGAATVSGNIISVSGAGQIIVTASQSGDSVYNSAASVNRTLTVNKASNSVSFNLSSLPALTYGDAPVDLKPYASSDPNGPQLVFSVVSGPATISNGVLTLTGAGPVVVRASVPGSDNYLAATPVDQTIQVGKRAMTITAVSTNRPAGQANPNFRVSYTGRVGSDVLPNPPAVTTLATSSSPTGDYTLTPAGASSPNYDISYATGTLTVTQTSVSSSGFSWSGSIDPISYGTPLSDTQLNAVNPSVAGTITYSPATGTVLPVGTNNVVATFTPSDTNSYSVTTLTNTVIVTKASLTVTADAVSKVAGQSDPVLTYQLAGTMAGSDTLAGSLGRTSNESRGTYAINIGSLAVDPSSSAGNYEIQFVSADFTITADSASVISSYDGTNTVPLVEDYEAIGVTGVDAGNVAAINTAIAFFSSTATDSKDEVQAIVNAYGLILSESGEGATDLNASFNPTFLTYQAIGVNLGTLDPTYPTAIGLLNDIVRRQGTFGVDTLAEVQTLAGIVERLMITAAGGIPSPALTAEEMTLIGLSGVTSSNLSSFLASVAASANDGSGIDTFTELQAMAQTQSGALAAISAAAQGNSATDTELSTGTYATAGVTGVTADNLAAINSALNDFEVIGTSADTTAEVQAIVDAFNTILGAADGQADGDAAPTAAQYSAIGVTGVSGTAMVALLGDAIDGKQTQQVNTVALVQALADAAKSVLDAAAGTSNKPTLDELGLLGIGGVTADNLAAVQAAIRATADTGTGVDTVAELQAVVNSGIRDALLAVISQAAENNSATGTSPSIADYEAVSVTGVDATNLGAINSALNSGAVNGAAADSTEEIQAIVDAYNAILGAADGLADGDTKPTSLQYGQIGVTGVTAGAATDLLGEVIDRKSGVDVNTVLKVQALADAVKAVMDAAAGVSGVPSLAQLQLLGITGVNESNLAAYQAALRNTDDSGSGVDTLAKTQALVPAVVANDDSLTRDGVPGATSKIAMSQLLTNDYYSTPLAPTVSLVSGATAQGGTVSVDNGWILYTSPSNLASSSTDSFLYQITDSLGNTATATVYLAAGDYSAVAVNIVSVIDAYAPSTGKIVTFAVTPNRSYWIYATSTLSAPINWQDLGGGGVFGGGDAGTIVIHDSGAGSQRFYKVEEYRP